MDGNQSINQMLAIHKEQELEIQNMDFQNLSDHDKQVLAEYAETKVLLHNTANVIQFVQNSAQVITDENGQKQAVGMLDKESYAELSVFATMNQNPELLEMAKQSQITELPLSEKASGLLRWLIGCLDNDGFLPESLEEISQSAPFPKDETELEDWHVALSLLQSFDPPGIGAKDANDSLLLQLKHLLNRKLVGTELAKLTEATLRDHLTLVAKHRYDELKNKLGCSTEEIKSVLEVISRLTPRPAAEFSADKINFIIPEIAVTKVQGRWTVRLISRLGSKIRLNDTYAQAVVQSKDKETMQLWKGRLTEARELLHSIEQREKTLLKVARAILAHQEAFFDKGPSALRPLVLRQIADETELHESTVSRACSGKYLICPLGVFELKYFFSSSVGPSDSGEAASAASVKAALKRLVDQEPKAKPLSDAKLASALEQQGFAVARRTVAKYRESLGIAPASERKNLD